MRVCVLIHVFRDYDLFSSFGDHNIVLAKTPFVSGRTGDLLHTTVGKHCVFFSVTYQSENWIADNKDILLCHYSRSTNLYVF